MKLSTTKKAGAVFSMLALGAVAGAVLAPQASADTNLDAKNLACGAYNGLNAGDQANVVKNFYQDTFKQSTPDVVNLGLFAARVGCAGQGNVNTPLSGVLTNAATNPQSVQGVPNNLGGLAPLAPLAALGGLFNALGAPAK